MSYPATAIRPNVPRPVSVDVPADPAQRAHLVDGLLAEGREHAERRELENAQRGLVAALAVPTYELPRLTTGVDLGALYELAGQLREQGMA